MKITTKKWLMIAGGLLVCAVLVYFICQQFYKEPVADTLTGVSSQDSDISVSDPDANPVLPENPSSSVPASDNGAFSSGKDQAIQSDPVKPEPPAPPSGAQGEHSGDDVDPADRNQPNPPSYSSNETEKKPPESKPSDEPPGFENVPDGGPNHVEIGRSDGDINKQVGTMG